MADEDEACAEFCPKRPDGPLSRRCAVCDQHQAAHTTSRHASYLGRKRDVAPRRETSIDVPSTMGVISLAKKDGKATEPSSYNWRFVDSPKTSREEGTLLVIKVLCTSLQPFDVMLIENAFGDTKEGDVPGFEGCGVVVKSFDQNFPAKTKVLFMTSHIGRDGAFAEFIKVDCEKDFVVKVPSELKLTDAQLACIPSAWVTAYRALEMADFTKGKSLLVTNASGSVGMALYTLAKFMGASQIICLGRTAKKVAKLVSAHIMEETCIDLSREKCLDGVKRMTDGKGVDCCVDLVGGEIGEQALLSLADWGCMVIVGLTGQRAPTFAVNPGSLLGSCLTLKSFMLPKDAARHHRQVKAALEGCLKVLVESTATVRVSQEFALGDLAKACEWLKGDDKPLGKIALNVAGKLIKLS